MKRLAVLAIVLLFILASCETVPEKVFSDYETTIENEALNDGVSVSVVNIQWLRVMGFSGGLGGIEVEVKNTGSEIVRISWGKSSINYGSSAYGIFLEGMKYIDAGKAPPDSVIPKNGAVTKVIHSSDQPYYASSKYVNGWFMRPIETPIQVMLCVEIGGKEKYATISMVNKSL